VSTPDREISSIVTDLTGTAEALGKLSADPKAFQDALTAFRSGDKAKVRASLEKFELFRICDLLCGWFCSKECVLRCIEICGPPPKGLAIPDVREFADATVRLTENAAALKRLLAAADKRDAKAFAAVLKELELERFCHLICHWICFVRCRLYCRVVCEPRVRPPDLLAELRRAGEALRKLAADPKALDAAAKAALADDCPELRRVIGELELFDHCLHLCFWFCSWRCVLRCLRLCASFPVKKGEITDAEILDFAKAAGAIAHRRDVLTRLVAAVYREDAQTLAALLKELKLNRFCIQFCQWICFLSCRRFCICVCPPLIAEIDDPTAGECAQAVEVPACTGPSGPLAAITIVGTAGGGGFDHYTLTYSWGGNPPIDDAVVYPDCGRPPAETSSGVPVSSGTLGYLDVTLLPPGITQFTVYLDVYDSGSGHVQDTTNFEIKTTAVEIRKVAKVSAFTAEDPFHLTHFTKLVKATIDPSPTVPEQSIGGVFSVDGSAYIVGCDRILSQFTLCRFDAPPASLVPTPANCGAGGTPIIAPVAYGDIPAHPWQSGCFPAITPNTVLNGDLVAIWSSEYCPFPPHFVPKVEGTFWDSTPLNGRFVIFLEARDRVLPGGAFPGTVAATDQVVVWIDNFAPTALITSIGGVTGCGDLHLKDYKGTTAEIRGVAWDPPIVPTAPQQRPNDNFGSYGLDYKKDGEVATFPIPGATPNTRVPNIWPGPPPPPPDGTLANWDIVAALDNNTNTAVPGKLRRRERCAYVISLSVVDTTHVGDSGMNHGAGPFAYAINVINDL
jgi:hypothetical protein